MRYDPYTRHEEAAMAGCKHDQGVYQAEEINNNGKIQHHYRCNSCDIIIRTS